MSKEWTLETIEQARLGGRLYDSEDWGSAIGWLIAEVKRLRTDNEILGMSPKDCLEEFEVLWQEYALTDDIELTSDAIDLKNRLRSLVREKASEL